MRISYHIISHNIEHGRTRTFASVSVDLDRAVDGPHEAPARDEAYGTGDQGEEQRHDRHVAEVEQARDETDQVEL